MEKYNKIMDGMKEVYQRGFDRRLRMSYLLADYKDGQSKKGDELMQMMQEEEAIRQKLGLLESLVYHVGGAVASNKEIYYWRSPALRRI